jgi:microcystin-dependent protein
MQYVVPASGGTQAAVASKGWDAVFDNGNPETGRIPSGKLAVSAVDSTQVLNGTLKREDFSEDALSGLIPTGVVLPWAGAGEAPYQPPAGWMLCKGQSIGKPGSGATYANDDASALYQLIWNQWSPVTLKLLRGIDGSPTVPGLSAAADWAANKQLILPDMRGRVAVGAGTSPGLTPRVLGAIDGEETHEITESEMPEHRHSGQTNHGNPLNYRTVVRSGSIVSPNHVTGYSEGPFVDRNDTNWPLFDHTHNFITNPSGGGGRMNIMQPSVFLQYIIKL